MRPKRLALLMYLWLLALVVGLSIVGVLVVGVSWVTVCFVFGVLVVSGVIGSWLGVRSASHHTR
jgi:uncharacterized membrane protein